MVQLLGSKAASLVRNYKLLACKSEGKKLREKKGSTKRGLVKHRESENFEMVFAKRAQGLNCLRRRSQSSANVSVKANDNENRN